MTALDYFFPNLAKSGYAITSPATPDYNCIAWAAQDDARWWWPDPYRQYFWPENAPREASVGAFVQAFGELGFLHCADGSFQQGFEGSSLFTVG